MRKTICMLLVSVISALLFSSCVKGPGLFYEKETYLMDGKGGELLIPILSSVEIQEVKIMYEIEDSWIEVLDYGKVEPDTPMPSVTFRKPETERYYIHLNIQPNTSNYVRRAMLLSVVDEIYEVPVEIIQTT